MRFRINVLHSQTAMTPQHNIYSKFKKTENRFRNTLFAVLNCVQGKSSNEYSSTIETNSICKWWTWKCVCGHEMNSLLNFSVTEQMQIDSVVLGYALLCCKQVYIMTFAYIFDLNGNFHIVRIRCLKCNNYFNSCEHRRHVFLEIFCIFFNMLRSQFAEWVDSQQSAVSSQFYPKQET